MAQVSPEREAPVVQMPYSAWSKASGALQRSLQAPLNARTKLRFRGAYGHTGLSVCLGECLPVALR